jgi:predicted nucleotidyltransferase
MLITPGQTFFGVSAKLLQFAAIELPGAFSVEDLCWELGAPPLEVEPVLNQLIAAGWIVPDAENPGRFLEAEPWGRLRMARIGEPLPRAKADKLVAEMVERVKAHNRKAADDVTLITEVYLFGSYLDPAKTELGDIDVAVAMAYPAKPAPLSDFSFKGMFARDKAVIGAVKNKSPYVSVCNIYQLDRLGCDNRKVYSVKDDPELWSPASRAADIYPEVHRKIRAGEPLREPKT